MHLAVNVHNIGFGNVVVGNDGGKGEKQQCDRQHAAAESGQYCIKGRLHISRTDLNTGQALVEEATIAILDIVETGQKNHKSGG